MGRRLCGEDEYPAPLLPVAGYRLPGAGGRPVQAPSRPNRFVHACLLPRRVG